MKEQHTPKLTLDVLLCNKEGLNRSASGDNRMASVFISSHYCQ